MLATLNTDLFIKFVSDARERNVVARYLIILSTVSLSLMLLSLAGVTYTTCREKCGLSSLGPMPANAVSISLYLL